jgi:hypothetical protein
VPAVARSLRECGRAMARRRGHSADLGYPVTPMLAHKWTRAGGGADFGPSRNGDGTVPASAQAARVWEGDGATAQAVCRPWVSGSHRCLHTCWRGRSMGQIFDHRETVMGAALAGAHSLRESRGAMARRRRLLFDLNAVAYTQSTNTLSMRSPNANLIYLPSRVSQVSCEDGQVFVEGQLTTSAYAC